MIQKEKVRIGCLNLKERYKMFKEKDVLFLKSNKNIGEKNFIE